MKKLIIPFMNKLIITNELIESALYSFLDGLRASQGEVN